MINRKEKREKKNRNEHKPEQFDFAVWLNRYIYTHRNSLIIVFFSSRMYKKKEKKEKKIDVYKNTKKRRRIFEFFFLKNFFT